MSNIPNATSPDTIPLDDLQALRAAIQYFDDPEIEPYTLHIVSCAEDVLRIKQ